MTGARDRLARSRQAIVEYVHRRERRYDPRVQEHGQAQPGGADRRAPRAGKGLFSRIGRVTRTWWQHHPAHMVLELADPLLRGYARDKPLQLLGIAALAGAALTFARPWRLISISALVLAAVKSSHLPGLLMSALSVADYDDDEPPV